jgi:hypothetical protein
LSTFNLLKGCDAKKVEKERSVADPVKLLDCPKQSFKPGFTPTHASNHQMQRGTPERKCLVTKFEFKGALI